MLSALKTGVRDGHFAASRLEDIIRTISVGLMALAAINGSFGGAGKVVDQNLSVAADKAEPVVRDAASDAGRAIGDATDRTETADRPG